jgi:hypothetical protein
MRYLNSSPVSRNVHITSTAPGSVVQTYHKILESVKSNSIPRGSWGRSTVTEFGPGQRISLGVCWLSLCARFYPPSLALKNADIPWILARSFGGIMRNQKHLA